MKTIIFFLLISLPKISFGQLKGEFCHNFGFGVECIKFLKNQRFEYTHDHCTGNDKGVGFYTLSDGNLILNFQTDSTNIKRNTIKFTKTATTKDSVIFEIFVLDEIVNEPLAFANPYIKNSDNKVVKSSLTDLKGKCRMKLPLSKDTLTFGLSYVGYGHFSYNIIPDQDYIITLSMIQGFGKVYKTGDSMTFRVKNLKDKSIELKASYDEARFTKYSKE